MDHHATSGDIDTLDLCHYVKNRSDDSSIKLAMSKIIIEIDTLRESLAKRNKAMKKIRLSMKTSHREAYKIKDDSLEELFNIKELVEDLCSHLVEDPKNGDKIKHRQVAKAYATRIIREMVGE